MTTIRVDPEAVLALGGALADLAENLALLGDPSADAWACGPGESGGALEELLGGWRHARLVLAGGLTDLADAAVDAGGLYLDTDAGVSRSLAGGTR